MKKSLFKNKSMPKTIESQTIDNKNILKPQFFHINTEYQPHPLFKELDWVFLQKLISALAKKHNVVPHALVMMDTHIHLLLFSGCEKENFFADDLQKGLLSQYVNTTELPSAHCEPIFSYPQYINTYKYIYNNPVVAGLSNKAENYPYSSLHSLIFGKILYCEVIDYLNLIQNPFKILKWLNIKSVPVQENDFNQNSIHLF